MDLALLRTFVTVARTGSVTVAARDLHLSQASVSRHLQRLESDLGTPLFLRRDGRRLELTDAAQRILVPATELVATAQDRWERLRELAAGRPEHIAVVVGPMVTSMPETVETLRRFHAEHPGRRRASLRGGRLGGRRGLHCAPATSTSRSAGCATRTSPPTSSAARSRR